MEVDICVIIDGWIAIGEAKQATQLEPSDRRERRCAALRALAWSIGTAPTSTSRQSVIAPSSSAALRRAVATGVFAFVALEIVALVLGVAVVGRHGGGPIQGWDNTVEQWWITHRAHLVGVSKVIAVLGDAPALGAISVVLTLILLALRQRMRALIPIVAYLGGEALVFITRQVIARPRPPTANYPAPHAIVGIHETSYSYPSGHATAAVAVLISLAVLAIITWRLWGWVLAGVLVLVAVAVACSRLVLGVHWFSDIAFGMLLGGSVGHRGRPRPPKHPLAARPSRWEPSFPPAVPVRRACCCSFFRGRPPC
ncbi:MAG: phosphatase PAP2 family protein [Steroidobacteraceae bacterium]